MDVVPGYEPLAEVFQTALDQSQRGKGKQRHSNDKPILQQPICEIGRMVGVGYNVGQAMKKGQESMRLPDDRAQAELLGAMVYLASAYLLIGERMAQEDAAEAARVALANDAAHKGPAIGGLCAHYDRADGTCLLSMLEASCNGCSGFTPAAAHKAPSLCDDAKEPFTFPPALKWMGKTGEEYVAKLLEEVNEVGDTNADDPRSTMMEAFDVIHAAETMIRTIAENTGISPAEVAAETVAKNHARGYYNARKNYV